jgi:catechol 2,3-dioxygenase-like lactoylglutathione lyase family enzyme
MPRGMSSVNLWADDLPPATRWYTELLGVMDNRHHLDVLGNRG